MITKEDRGTLFVKLGNDTTVIQHFEIKGDSVNTTIIYKPRGIVVTKATGNLYPDGNLKSMNSTVFRAMPDGELQRIQENRLYTTNDSTIIELNSNGRKTFKSFPGRCFVTNEMDISAFFVFPYLGHYAPKGIKDSIVGNHIGLGTVRRYTIIRSSVNELTAGSNLMGYLKLAVHDNGNLRAIDALGSSLNFTGVVGENVNMDSLITALTRQQQQQGIMSPPTVRDTVSSTIGSATIEINYWRPSMRGRKIFGVVVPWNRFWRAGANHATKLRITQPIYFNNQKLDTGRYSIFILPTENEWTLMINKQPDIWGTDYDASQDVLRLPMKVDKLSTPVEQLTINIVPSNNGGIISIEWENTRALVSFSLTPN